MPPQILGQCHRKKEKEEKNYLLTLLTLPSAAFNTVSLLQYTPNIMKAIVNESIVSLQYVTPAYSYVAYILLVLGHTIEPCVRHVYLI